MKTLTGHEFNSSPVISGPTLSTLAAGQSAEVLHANPNRVWAVITNNTLDWCRVVFGGTGTLAANGHRLDIGGVIVINNQLPHIGPVTVFSPAGSAGCTITITEATADE
jgi:hypothetical protein